ncbi:MAG: alpha/beta fold hydrolase [Bdellovibrionales bacterium]|jgi:pimeloyl-ACP methyl ester carboxylesterase
MEKKTIAPEMHPAAPPLEEPFSLAAVDGKKIYGLLNRSRTPSKKVIVLAHGFTGHPREYLHVIARNFFAAKGYDVVRFSFYSQESDARKLVECTIQTHADDLAFICDHFRPLYDKLYVAGHSYGGKAMIHANTQAAALGFWDSSFLTYETFWKANATKLEGTPYYTAGWGCDNLINPAMIEMDKNTSESDLIALAQKITTPSLVITAENEGEPTTRTILYDALICPKSYVEIKGADHCFTNGDTVYDMLERTLEWFNQH